MNKVAYFDWIICLYMINKYKNIRGNSGLA
jgi:hypothetical protein